MTTWLSVEQQQRVEAFFVEWCDAHKRAGTPDDALVLVTPLVNSRTESADGVPTEQGGTGEVIPDGTLAWAIVKVRPWNLDQGLVLTPSKSTEGNAYLDVELTIIDGPYAGRKVVDTITLRGSSLESEKWVMGGMAAVRHILEVGRLIDGFAATDPKYRLGKPGDQGDIVLMELNELRCAIKVGVEKGENKIREYLSPNPNARHTYDSYTRLIAAHDVAMPDTETQGPVAPAKVRLDDAAGIANAYIRAVGGYDRKTSKFADKYEWEFAAGANVGIFRPDGSIESAFAAFDDSNESEDVWHIQRNEDGSGYEVDPASLPEEDEEAAQEIMRHAAGILKTWGSRTKLIKFAGGQTTEHNADLRRYVLRGGFVDKPIVAASELEGSFREIGLSTIGELRLGHILNMGSFVAGNALMDSALLLRVANVWKLTGGDLEVALMMPGVASSAPKVSFVAPELIVRGVLTIVAGDAGVGKSTLFHDLALLVGTKPEDRDPTRTWLGIPAADIAHGTAIFLSGEDDQSILVARREALGSKYTEDIVEIPLNGLHDPMTLLDKIRTVPGVALLVVDPARSFIKGNEDESSNVDEALTVVSRFAEEKHCSSVMLHHLRKNARPASPHDAVEGLRGSGAFKARARVAIGMVRRGDVVSLGVTKHNVPPPFRMQTATKKFRRQEGIPRLVAIEVADAPAALVDHGGGPDRDVARIVDAVAGVHRRGDRITSTGRQGIYESELPELAGMSRPTVRAATKRAVANGAISRTAAGYLVPCGLVQPPVAAVADAASGQPGNGVVILANSST